MKPSIASASIPIKVKRYLGAFTATVTTNYVDYQPGDRVVITGSGWLANETVTLTIVESDGDLPWMSTAVADSAGNIYNDQFVIQAHDVGVSFTLTATGATSNFSAMTTFTDQVVVDFRQSANNETNGTVTGLGNIHWINSIVQNSNSRYFEGMSNFQRSIFTSVPATTGDVHTLSFSHESTKGGIHAYDFLTSYDQALADDSAALGVTISLNPCGVEIGPPGTLSATCSTLRAGSNFVDVVVPDDPYISKDGSTAAKIAAYEATHGNRTIRIYGDAPITNASLVLCHDVAAGADTGDSDVHYVLQWTSTSTQILVEMAGHLAVTGDGTGESWGPGLGSSQISGGPYHFNLDKLGGSISNPSICPPTQSQITSLGAQDNQIKGADILIQCPTCTVSGPADPVCPGSSNVHSVSLTGTCTSPSTTWTITGNGTISGSTTGSSITVIAGSTCNASYTVTATTTCATCPTPTVCTDTVLVNDTTPPVITCPTATSPIQCPATPSFSSPTVTDNCDPSPTVTFADVTTPGRCAQESSVTRTWTATDHCGNSATCSQTVNIVDTTAPVISSLPGPSTIDCPATPSFATPTATDVCDPSPTLTFADVTTPGSCPQAHSVTRTWTATDHCGNTSSSSQTISVVDNTPPTITCPTATSPIECPATPSFPTPTVSDVCDPSPTVTFADVTTPGSCPQEHSVTRTWTATDHCGNSATCSQTVVVRDTTAPVISDLPGPSTIDCPATPSFATPTATDVCDPSPTLTFADVTTPGSCPQNFSVTRTWTATDHCGNSSTKSQTINVVDNTAPVISDLPVPSTIECPASPSFATPTATDTCDPNPTLTFVDVTTPGSCPQAHSVTRTWTATDHCGNSSTKSQTINVVDNTPPTITCAGPSTIECPLTPSFPPPTVSDACDPNPTVTFSDVTTPGSCPQNFSVTRTWTATDHCGNAASCSQTIIVQDTTPPTIACPGNVTRGECNNVVNFAPTVGDACDLSPTVVCIPPSGTAFHVGTTTVNCAATDHCGNSSSCSFTVTVVPLPTCSITPPASNPVCGTSGNILNATVTGAGSLTLTWSVAGIGWTIDSGQGTNSITYTAGPSAGTATFTLLVVDAFGCSHTCSLDVSCSPPQVDNCTLTQGFYGNQNGKFNGIDGPTLVTNLLASGDLVVGIPGVRSLTIKGGTVAIASDSAKCLVKRMPANQTPTCLPDFNPVDQTLSSFGSCQTPTPIPLNGLKWSNVLLGQVVTLSLNLRLDTAINEPGHVALADRTICNTFVTQGALPGPDRLLGTNDDTINPADSPQTFSIPVSVTCALTHLGLPHTVGGLLELANRALACQCTDVASHGDINLAVDAINRGFDRCRFLLSCTDSSATCPPPASCTPIASLLNPNSGDRTVAQAYSPVVSATFVNRLNLFGWLTDSNSLIGKLLTVPVDRENNPGYQRLAG